MFRSFYFSYSQTQTPSLFVSPSSFSDAHALFASQLSFPLSTDRDSTACPTAQSTLSHVRNFGKIKEDKPSQANVF
jgi:hypothetical protein